MATRTGRPTAWAPKVLWPPRPRRTDYCAAAGSSSTTAPLSGLSRHPRFRGPRQHMSTDPATITTTPLKGPEGAFNEDNFFDLLADGVVFE